MHGKEIVEQISTNAHNTLQKGTLGSNQVSTELPNSYNELEFEVLEM